ncbi:hypothetical protein ACSYAD_35415, partial [Acaryochloris marina NIES-2412]|uniref:hypothetical protein n=1 Tax=Acaryochloris marina TaxID=155978 RepID=UPI004058A932
SVGVDMGVFTVEEMIGGVAKGGKIAADGKIVEIAVGAIVNDGRIVGIEMMIENGVKATNAAITKRNLTAGSIAEIAMMIKYR